MSWRDHIFQSLQANMSSLILAADPDGLLLEEDVLSTLEKMGFNVLTVSDSITFRYVYELNYRSRWDRGESAQLIVVVQGRPQELHRLPYDVWKRGNKLFFSLAYIFPRLSYPVVIAMEKSDMDKLYSAYQHYNGPTLGDNETKDFILKYVFGIIPELINSPVELLKMLLSRHCNFVSVPPILDEYLIQCLKEKNVFRDWPLEDIIPGREAFFAFLQEKWRRFLESTARGENFTEVPFDHYDIRVYIDNLFLEGNLRPVPVASAEGIVCVENIAGKHPHPVNYDNIPGCTYCQPQVASVGLTEEKAREKGYELKIGRYPFRSHGKALALNETEGFVKLIFDARYGELLGAHIIGPEATEMIAELVVARTLETTQEQIVETIHAHPTLTEGVAEAALDAYGMALNI